MLATVSDLYRSRGLSLRKKGDGGGERGEEWCGPCPGCGGTDRFLVWPRQNGGLGSYACRRCNAAGDSIQFLRDFAGMSFFDAARAAGHAVPDAPRKSCPAVPSATVAPSIEAADPDAPNAVWSEKAGNFARVCHEALMQDEPRLAWLSARGLPTEAVIRFGLGWNEGEGDKKCLIRPRKIWGLPDVIEAESGKTKSRLWLPRGLVIPAVDRSGSVVRLRIRRPEEDREGVIKAPYYVIPGSSKMPILLEQTSGTLPRGAVCLVVESDLDAEACAHAASDLCAVLPVMTANISKLPPRIMRFLASCSVILVATDFGDKKDAKGSRAGTKGWEKWRATFSTAKRWPCVRGKDPGEMFAAGVSIRTWILAGLPESLARIATGSASSNPATTPAPVSPACCSQRLVPAPEAVRELCRAFREHPFSLVLKKDGGVKFESPWSWRGNRHDLYGHLTRLALSAEVHDWLLTAFPDGGPVCDETLTEKIRISYA